MSFRSYMSYRVGQRLTTNNSETALGSTAIPQKMHKGHKIDIQNIVPGVPLFYLFWHITAIMLL